MKFTGMKQVVLSLAKVLSIKQAYFFLLKV